MSGWTLEIYNTQATTPIWYTDTYNSGFAVKFPRSTKSIVLGKKSTSTYVKLVDGSEAVIQPATSTLKPDIRLSASPLVVTDEMVEKLTGYMDDNIGLRITTHTGDILEGYIKSMGKSYEATGQDQLYSLNIMFHPFDVDGSGSY